MTDERIKKAWEKIFEEAEKKVKNSPEIQKLNREIEQLKVVKGVFEGKTKPI